MDISYYISLYVLYITSMDVSYYILLYLIIIYHFLSLSNMAVIGPSMGIVPIIYNCHRYIILYYHISLYILYITPMFGSDRTLDP